MKWLKQLLCNHAYKRISSVYLRTEHISSFPADIDVYDVFFIHYNCEKCGKDLKSECYERKG